MLETTTIQLQSKPFEKNAVIYQDISVPAKAVILYFHGGGLLYGDGEDLPSLHKELFTSAGYVIISFDYPLAPAAKVDDILADVLASIQTYINTPDILGLPNQNLPYILWGRSAGAYLCLLAAAKGNLSPAPAAVLSYYGYGFLCDGWFKEPNIYYRSLPLLDSSCITSLPKEIHANGSLDTHYSAYVYARQTGEWLSLMYEGREKFFYLNDTLRLCDTLPCPLFAAHSTQDPDVPYAEFQELLRKYHPTTFIASGKVHDFDRDTEKGMTKDLLNATLSFLSDVL